MHAHLDAGTLAHTHTHSFREVGVDPEACAEAIFSDLNTRLPELRSKSIVSDSNIRLPELRSGGNTDRSAGGEGTLYNGLSAHQLPTCADLLDQCTVLTVDRLLCADEFIVHRCARSCGACKVDPMAGTPAQALSWVYEMLPHLEESSVLIKHTCANPRETWKQA